MKKKGWSSRELIRLLEQDGWEAAGVTGSHHHYKHPRKKGKVTVPHPKKDLPEKTGKNILMAAGLLK